MALTFNIGNYIYKAAPVTALPLTLVAWVLPTAIGADGVIMGLASSTAGHSTFLSMKFLTASAKVCAAIGNDAGSTTDVTAASSQTLSAGVLAHVACVFASTTSRTCYVNGANAVASSVSVTIGTPDYAYIGAIKYNNALAPGFAATVAFPGIYKAALSADDVKGLSLRFGPPRIRTPELVGYPMLVGASPEPDHCGGSWTVVAG